MTNLKNWAGNFEYSALKIHHPQTVNEIQDVVQRAKKFGFSARVILSIELLQGNRKLEPPIAMNLKIYNILPCVICSIDVKLYPERSQITVFTDWIRRADPQGASPASVRGSDFDILNPSPAG